MKPEPSMPKSLFKALCLILVATLIAGCNDRDVHRLETIAKRESLKAAKRLTQDMLKDGGTQVATGGNGEIDATELVNGKGAVGHRDFNSAKKVLPGIFTGELKEEFYCGCQYEGKAIDLASCGYVARKNENRARRIEWEHIVPAWEIGHQRQCWQNGGRKNCSESDSVYQVAEGDLNNLVPSIGEVNGDRSNFPYSQWASNPEPIYGQCKTVVDFQLKRAQPRPEVRGRIARVFFYMHERYKLGISKQDRQLMCAWAKTYPIDQWEVTRNERIVALQGEGNRYVEDPAALMAGPCAN